MHCTISPRTRMAGFFVVERSNSRVQISDQDGSWLATWTQFGSLSGLYIDTSNKPYSADSESNIGPGLNPEWLRGRESAVLKLGLFLPSCPIRALGRPMGPFTPKALPLKRTETSSAQKLVSECPASIHQASRMLIAKAQDIREEKGH